MDTKRQKAIYALKIGSFALLVVTFIFFAKEEIIQKFAKNVTTFGSKAEIVDFFSVPVLILCPPSNESYKKQSLAKNNISNLYFTSPSLTKQTLLFLAKNFFLHT